MKTSNNLQKVSGGVTAALGYKASGISAGIKHSRPDLALVFSEQPARAAAVYTQNTVKGDHIAICESHLKNGRAQAILINSGCANACVGKTGLRDATAMAAMTADALSISPTNVLVCSTGTIGIKLPMLKIAKGIPKVASALKSTSGLAAAKAIMTTDTRAKHVAVELKVAGKVVRVGGMAKGSGMIEPNMATMLGFLTTDANISAPALRACLSDAVAQSFNRISVDGDQSCNDTVILMANGMAKTPLLNAKHRDWKKFCAAVNHVCRELAVSIVKDGEGATRFVTVTVKGARTEPEAESAVRAVANSLLVKTSWFGGDPNWGRIIDAVGYSEAQFDPRKTSITFNGVAAVKKGERAKGVSLKTLEKIYRKSKIDIDIDLHAGKASRFVFTCDCSFDYVKINSEYMT